MVEVQSVGDLERWFGGRNREEVLAIAARAALRAIPLLSQARGADNFRFRVLQNSWRALDVVALFINRQEGEAYTAIDAASGADARIAAAARVALYAARFIAYGNDYTFNVSYSIGDIAATTRIAIWPSVSRDASALEAGASPQDLLASPLWPEGVPDQTQRAWSDLKLYLAGFPHEHWEVWTDWYEDRLAGRPIDWDLQRDRVMIPFEENLWAQGPAVVNARLREIIEEHQARAPSEPEAKTPPANPSPPSGVEASQAAPAERLKPPSQLPDSLHFMEEGELIVADLSADAEKVRQDRRGRGLYDRAFASVSSFHEILRGNNAHPDAQDLGKAAQEALEALGPSVEETEPALLASSVVEMERLHRRYQKAADAANPEDSRTQPLEDLEMEAFDRMVGDLRFFVDLDPTLNGYLLRYRQEPQGGPSTQEGMAIIQEARADGLTDDATIHVFEKITQHEGEGARRAFENFLREAIVVANDPKAVAFCAMLGGAGGYIAGAVGWGALPLFYYATAKFLVKNKGWFWKNIPKLAPYVEELERRFPLL